MRKQNRTLEVGGPSIDFVRSRKCKITSVADQSIPVSLCYISTIEKFESTYRYIATSQVVKALTSELWWLHAIDGELETLKLEKQNLASFSA